MEGMTLTFPATSRPPRKTCTQCRQRKVRCRGQRPGGEPCENCHRLGFTCTLQGARAFDANDLPKPEPRRISRACVRCRDHKIKCSGGQPCITCSKKSTACHYPFPAASRPPQPVGAQSQGSVDTDAAGPSSAAATFPCHQPADNGLGEQVFAASAPTPNQFHEGLGPSNIAALVDAFFQHIYPLPSYAFLHPGTTRRKFAEGSLDKCLSNAIAAIASLRAPGISRKPEHESAWVQEAENLIWRHLESPSIARLQGMLLVILYRVESGQLRRAFMLASLAGRAAAAMRLNHERPGSSAIALEVRRRLMWSLKLVERYFSVGLPEFELCPVDNIYIQLPSLECDFSGDTGEAWGASDDRGSYHICVQLEMFRRDVMKLHRSLALCDQPFPGLQKLMQDFKDHLDRIGSQLPDGPDLTPAQLSDLMRNRWLPRHLLMRLSWHQCHCDLYRLLLRNFRDAAPRPVIDSLDLAFLNQAEALCIHHAKSIVQTIATLKQDLPEEPIRLLEFDSAICSYTASRLLLFTARFGYTPDRPTEAFALSRAELCLAAVRRFFPQSLLVRPIVEELRRLMDVFGAKGTPTPSRFSSPKLSPGQHRDPTRQLSSEARIRQRLAIHSLLRQANFSDEDDDEADNTDEPEPLDLTSAVEEEDHPMPALPPVPTGSGKGAFGSETYTTPETQTESEPWPHKIFTTGDLLQDEDMENTAPSGLSLNQRSFSFPWLQREDSVAAM